MRPSIPSRLERADWEDLLPRLLLVARRFYARALVHYRGAPEPRDLVQQAITDLMDGRRTLPEDVPLFTVLCGVMRSQVSNYVARQQPVGSDTEHAAARHTMLTPDMAGSLDTTDGMATDDLRARLYQVIGDDELLQQIIDLLLEDSALKPRDLAEMLDVPVRTIYNAKRRLKRKMKSSDWMPRG